MKTWQIEILIALTLTMIGLGYLSKNYNPESAKKPTAETKITKEAPKDEKTPEVKPAANEEIKILFVGDTMLARSVGDNLQKGTDPFELIRPTFLNYGAVIANLETTISDKGAAIKGKAWTFLAPVESTNYLQSAGITAVSLANNHTKDYGDEALLDTISRLNAVNIKNFGAGATKDAAFSGQTIEVGSVKIGLIAFNEIENKYTMSNSGPTSAWTNLPLIKQSITELKKTADLVIIMPHWGTEYSTGQTDWQRQLGQKLIDAGADLIIGNHPHVVQPSEDYNGKKIYYSLGNFVFDKMEGLKGATSGEMVEVVIENKQIKSSTTIAIKIGKDGRPTLANP